MTDFWCQVFNPIPLIQNLIANIIWIVGIAISAYTAYRFGRKVHPVRIQVRKIVGPELARTLPSVLIATVSPYPRQGSPLSDADFAAALANGDLNRLPLEATTQSIGALVRVLDTYRHSLKELFLITTVSEIGTSSLASVPLLRNYALRSNPDLILHADREHAVSLDEDNQVAETAHLVATRIFDRLHDEKRYVPDGSRILVDVTGGPRAMQIGVVLACLRPEQDIHLVGMKYKPTGEPDYNSSFPMVIHFEPDLRFSK